MIGSYLQNTFSFPIASDKRISASSISFLRPTLGGSFVGFLLPFSTFFCLCRGAFTRPFSMIKKELLALPAHSPGCSAIHSMKPPSTSVATSLLKKDILLNTLGAFLGIWIFEKYINRISENTQQRINQWTVRIGGPFAALAYINVIVAMILYFS